MKRIIAVNFFRKTLHHRCLTGFSICLGFWICQRSEYTGVLDIPGLWICQGSEYAYGSEYVRILDSSEYASVTKGSEYAWICLNNSWICLNNSWICLIMPEYAQISLNGFWLTFTYCNPVSKGTTDCFLEE